MTAAQFNENVTNFSELEDFLDEEQDSYLSDNEIRWHESLDDAIDEDVSDSLSYYNYGWKDLYDSLRGVHDMDEGDGWYRKNGIFDYDYLDDDDFEDIKSEVYDRYLSHGWFDEEDDDDDPCEEEEDPYVDPEDLIPLEEESVSFGELFVSSVDAMLKAREERIESQKKKEAEEAKMFEDMLAMCSAS